MLPFLKRQWFLTALALVLLVGFGFSPGLQEFVNAIPHRFVVACILFLMAFPLNAGSMWEALRFPRAVLLAIAMSYGLLPLVAWGITPLLPTDLANGLMIAAAIPCTMASAVVWTRRAGGNDAISLMVTMITNFACFVVTPLWLFWSTGQSIELDPIDMMIRLGVSVVLPMTIAQLLRLAPPLGAFATRYKVPMSTVAQFGILTMVLIGSVNAGNQLRGVEVAAGGTAETTELAAWTWAAMIAAVIGVHVAILVAGHVIGRLVGLSREDRIAVGFAGSQKTLAIGLYIALTFYSGLALLPMICFHVAQLTIDTAVADRLRVAGLKAAPAPSG